MKYKALLGLAVLSLTLAGCGGGGGDTPTTPTVPPTATTFVADRTTYNVGDTATLTATFTGTNAHVEPGLGNVQSGIAVKTPVLKDNIQYRLLFTQNGAEVSVPLNLSVQFRNSYTDASYSWPRSHGASTVLPDGSLLFSGGLVTSQLSAYDNQVLTYNEAAGRPDPIGNMLTFRNSHLMTALADGKVLITGGVHYAFDQNKSVSGPDVELFDPVSRVSKALGSMRYQNLFGQTGTLLPNGKVLFVGGWNDASGQAGPLAYATLWDPKNQTFADSSSTLATARAYHTATLLKNGKVLIAGGQTSSGTGQYAELYDPATDRFTPVTGASPVFTILHIALLRADGSVLLMGGMEILNNNMPRSVYRYDPVTNTLAVQADIPSVLVGASPVTLGNGDVLLFGAGSVYKTYESRQAYSELAYRFTLSDELKPLASMPVQRTAPIAHLLPSGKVLLLGGDLIGSQFAPMQIYQ